MNENESDHMALLCHRCGVELTPGAGNFYFVRIEAFADPTPPTLSADQINAADLNAEFSRVLEEMRHMTERELMDQVYRSLTIHLCGSCYRRWIEDPAGSPEPGH